MKSLKHQILLAICFIAYCGNSISDGFNVIPVKTTVTQWGFLGHKTINQHAVFALPQPLFGFYKKHIQFITDHAVDPDQRRYSDTAEACRHYIDLDHYEKSLPIDTLPKYWMQAVEKFTADTLFEYGIVPYHVQMMLYRLTKAFQEKNLAAILRLSADIGHYVADVHVPLHTTENYDGQLTHQHGIHALWETRIPEISLPNYNLLVPFAHYLPQPTDSIWSYLQTSHSHRREIRYPSRGNRAALFGLGFGRPSGDLALTEQTNRQR